MSKISNFQCSFYLPWAKIFLVLLKQKSYLFGAFTTLPNNDIPKVHFRTNNDLVSISNHINALHFLSISHYTIAPIWSFSLSLNNDMLQRMTLFLFQNKSCFQTNTFLIFHGLKMFSSDWKKSHSYEASFTNNVMKKYMPVI